jgi:hypothetical protein
MKYKLAGICRESRYSPNHTGNDAAIFNLTAEYLQLKDCEITVYSEAEFCDAGAGIHADAVFNMVRDRRSIRKLQALEDQGACVVNSAYGIENCMRERMTRLLISNHIPHPDSVILDTNAPDIDRLMTLGAGHVWIKRGDAHAIYREDVTFAGSLKETENVLKEYALRGIPSAVVNEHLQGDLIKFYGVGGGFFHWFYPDVQHHSKFGLEVINGAAQGFDFDADGLKDICRRASRILNVDIYGGDAVVSADGTVRIIDFNDWPSFAPCRRKAAPAIATAIYTHMLQHRAKRTATAIPVPVTAEDE